MVEFVWGSYFPQAWSKFQPTHSHQKGSHFRFIYVAYELPDNNTFANRNE